MKRRVFAATAARNRFLVPSVLKRFVTASSRSRFRTPRSARWPSFRARSRRALRGRPPSFPLQWQRVDDLVTGRVCVDPALHFHEGHWYLFANVAESGNSTWDELFLFVSERTPWVLPIQDPCNPIVSDVRRARLAGRLFSRDGKLIRPAQDCSPGYGAAVVFNEVLELDPAITANACCRGSAPDWSASLDGCHTYSAAGGIEVLDAHGVAPAATAIRTSCRRRNRHRSRPA